MKINRTFPFNILFVGLCLCLIFFPYNNSNSADSNSAVIEVERYCEFDFNGARLSSGVNYEKLRNLMAWEEEQDEPGWDCFMIISDYKIINNKVKQNTAKVTVKYNVLSRFCSDYSLEKKSYADMVNFELTKIDGFWKIKDYVPYPRISKDIAIKHLKNRLKLLKQDSVETDRIVSLIKSLEKL